MYILALKKMDTFTPNLTILLDKEETKMKKAKLLFGVCVLGLILSGCNEAITPSNQNTSQHEHLFSTEWVYDAENHWHESTCGHDVTSGKAKHIFKTEVIEPTSTAKGYTKYICEICGYNYKGDETNPVSNISVPTGLSYASASKTLEWNIVSGATSYVVSVDNRERASSTNYFDVTSLGLSNGEHTAKVKAVNANLSKESAYSDSITFSYTAATSNSTGKTLDSISLSEPKTVVRGRNTRDVTLDDMVSYKDDHYYYFVFDLGNCYNIPVDTPYDYCIYSGAGEVTKTMTATSAKANTIEESSTKAQDKTTGYSKTHTFDVEVTVGRQPPQKTGGWKFDFSIEYGFTKTDSGSTTNSWSETFREASQFSESESRTTSITFRTGDPAGYYYYYLAVDTRVYGAIVRSIESGDFYVTTTSSVIGRGFNYIYTGDDRLNFTYDGGIDFNYDLIDTLGLKDIVPTTYVGDKQDDGKTHVKNVSELYEVLSDPSADANIILDDDIDCTNYPWMPIDNFNGKFDGNDKEIQNLSFEVYNGGNETKFGIFKELNGTFANVTITNADISVHKFHDTQNYMYAGIVCGRLTGGTIELVDIKDSDLFAYHDSDNRTLKIHAHVGGFVGELASGSIKNCNVAASNIYGKARINYDKNSTADVWCYTGGFVGHQVDGTIYKAVRSNDVFVKSHTISGSKTSAYHCFVGGIIGYKDGGTYSNCASTDTNLDYQPEVVVNGSANTSNHGKGAITGNN